MYKSFPRPTLVDDVSSFNAMANRLLELHDTFIGVDTETTGVLPFYGDEIVGLSFYDMGQNEGWYVPIAHGRGTLLESQLNLPQAGIDFLVKLLFRLDKNGCIFLFWNAMFDLAVLAQLGFDVIPKRFVDVQIAAHLINETQPMNLTDRATLGGLAEIQTLENQIRGMGGKDNIYLMDPSDVMRYGIGDAWAPVALWIDYSAEIERLEIEDLLRLEHALIPLLARGWRQGFSCDTKAIKKAIVGCSANMEKLSKQIHKIFNKPYGKINIGSPPQLMDLFGIKSTAKGILEELPHPAAAPVLQWRGLQKARDSYYEKMLEHMEAAPDGKLHPSLNQTGTRTGRFSCTNPNLQSMPRQSNEAIQKAGIPTPRECLIADEGQVFIFADYSQAELRLQAHYSRDERMLDVFAQGRNVHAETADILWGPGSSTDKELYHKGKTTNFAMTYGAGYREIALQLNISEGEAQKLVATYRRAYPGLPTFARRAEMKAAKQRHVRMWDGRYARFGSEEETYKASSYLIQGGVAQIVKRAMVALDKELLIQQLGQVMFQIHDEIVITTTEAQIKEATKVIRAITEDFEFDPPPQVDISVGVSWGDKHEVKV